MDATVVGHRVSTLPADDDHPYRTGAWRPQTKEWDADRLEVTGELPADLTGVYLRNTENPLRPPIKRYHPFDGDGMVHALAFAGGQASYRNRFVLTDGLAAEEEAGEALWAGIAESPRLSKRPDGWGCRGGMKDASSTDVVVHAGKALTTFWQCGDVYQLDPLTLGQKGKAAWVDLLPTPAGVSAHARVDEHSGDLMFFNYSTTAPYLHYGVVDSAGRLAHCAPIDLPGPRLPHDLAFTERFTVLNDLPLISPPGVYAPRFHPDVPSRFGVVPRFGSSDDVVWFEAEATYVLHWANAFEDGDEVVLDGFFQSSPEPAEAAAGGPTDRTFRFLAADALGTRLHRWRFDMRSGAVKEEDLSDRITEFGMIPGNRRGRRHRYVYATTNPAGWFLMDGIVKHDTDTGAVEEYRFPDGVFCSETAAAPRAGANAEDDAYLVTIAIDVNRDRSYGVVLAADRLSDGPIATMALPERVCSGTHAFWASGVV
jgi:carotenoid cleavage dioxygenase